MTDLPARLEAADPKTADLRALSDLVLKKLGWKRGEAFLNTIWPPDHPGPDGDWDEYESRRFRDGGDAALIPPSPAESVDDGLVLLRGMGWKLAEAAEYSDGWYVSLKPESALQDKKRWVRSEQATSFEGALSAALVRAHAVQEAGE